MDWFEIVIKIPAADVDAACAVAQMAVPYGIYIEDYSSLEEEAMEIAKIDLIDEDLLKKDRTTALIHLYIPHDENPAEAAAYLSERLTACGIKNSISTDVCRNEDWENNWKEYFKPLPVGEKLLIQPLWEEDVQAGGRAVLRIEPGLAFGTGGHHTTRLCLEQLEKEIHGGEKVLDIGCGSGILSIAALLFGAESALGIDIDELAVKTAAENAKINGFTEPVFTAVEGDLTEKAQGKYDVIAANIVADAIIGLSPAVGALMEDDGVFLTSGIIDSREEEVLAAFASASLAPVRRMEESGWLCFVCKKL